MHGAEQRRIPVGERVIHEQECAHHDRRVNRGRQNGAREQPPERHAVVFLPIGEVAPAFEPDRAFLDPFHDEEDQQRRQHADPQHYSPAEISSGTRQRVSELEHEGREQQAKGVPALHHARRSAAQVGRPVLERERHAGSPDAAHADAEQGAAGEQHAVGRGEAAEEGER